MSLKVKENHLRLESRVGDNSVETVFQGTVELPNSALEVGRVVWVKGNGVINSLKVLDDKVNIDGVIDIQLVYVPEQEEGDALHPRRVEWQGAIPFSHAVEIIGAEPGMHPTVNFTVMNCDWDVRPDQRALDIDVLAKMDVSVSQVFGYTVLTGASISAPKKLTVDDFPINAGVTHGEIEIKKDISGMFDVPDGFGEIEEVLDVVVDPVVSDKEVINGKVHLAGNFSVEVVYVDKEGVIQRLLWEDKLPFQFEAEDDSLGQDMELREKIRVDKDFFVVNDGAALRVEVALLGKLLLVQRLNTRGVVDLTSPSGERIETRKDTIRVDNIVNEKSQQISAQGVIELDEKYPPIRDIIRTTGKANLTDYRVDEDKVVIEGTVDVEILYNAHSDGEIKPLYCGVFPNAVDIQQVMVIGGVEPGMLAEIRLDVVNISPDLINRETVEIEAVCRSYVTIKQPVEEEVVVEALEVGEPDPDPPTITYVVTQPQDTLWKLAKRYHTSVEAILGANSWLREAERDGLGAGEKICIPRKPTVKPGV